MSRLELDPELNFAPEGAQTIHLIGICGTAMGALAGMLVSRGYTVTGSDQNVYPPMSDFLFSRGIRVFNPYSPANLDHKPDLVVVGNVVTRENPESPRLKEMGLPYISLPQALRLFFLQGKKPLVVAGTHGKTTTSSLAAWLLDSAGKDPGFMIGGILGNYDCNYTLGDGEWFVVEGDEYDTAFFNKVPKFVHYAPHVGILTGIEYDHADIYPDMDAVIRAFESFMAIIPKEGLLVACGDDPLVRQVAAQCAAPVIYYGLGQDNDWRALDLKPEGRRMGFTLTRPGADPLAMVSPLPGRHNVLNTVAVACALNRAGLEPASLQPGLDAFLGIKRRQEVRGQVDGVTVLDDFAHHPTAVRETVAGVRAAYRGRLITVFEPRTNTSRRRVFQSEYARAFEGADEILIRVPPDLEKAPEGDRFSAAKLVEDLCASGKSARLFQETDSILAALLRLCRPGDVVLIMSNGGFDRIHQRLLDGLKARAARATDDDLDSAEVELRA